LAVLGVELRVLHLLGGHSTLKPHPRPFCFKYFSHRVSQAVPDYDRHAPPCSAFTG
jgi:hypothetical protein